MAFTSVYLKGLFKDYKKHSIRFSQNIYQFSVIWRWIHGVVYSPKLKAPSMNHMLLQTDLGELINR